MAKVLGDVVLHAINDGSIAFDGGAMFGVVPRLLWAQQFEPDAKNRIRLALRCLLVETKARRILIDNGAGTRWEAIEKARYGIKSEPGVISSLAAAGFRPEDVTDVVLTHLHFDHAGGTTVVNGGVASLAFPRADYWLQRSHWNWAHAPSERDRRSFRPSESELLESSGRLHLLDGPTTLFDVVHLTLSDGHTRGLQIPRVESGGQSVVFPSDLIPTVSHLNLPWIAAYDLEPMKVLEEKRALLQAAVENHWSIFFEHDPNVVACTLRRAANGEAEVATTEAF